MPITLLLPRYHLDLIRDAADQVVYEESANYGYAFTFIIVGIIMVVLLAVTGARFDLSFRKLFASLFGGGFIFCCLSIPFFTKSKITLDREQQALAVRRSLLGVAWTHRYRIEDIENFYEGSGYNAEDKSQLAFKLTNGRTKKLTLWAQPISLSAEEAHLNEALNRIRSYAGRKHTPVTEEQDWAQTKENALADFRKSLRRTLYCLVGFTGTVMALVPFLAGHFLHRYWGSAGTILLFLSMALWVALIFEAVLSFSNWRYVRDLTKIDKEYDAEKD